MNQKKTNKKPNKSNKPPRIKATREYTAGGVVFRRADSGIQLLMIQDAKERWTIPKGHVEEGESLEQTGLREVSEETGLTKLKIRARLDKLHFFYRREGKLIFMTTQVYLMEALGETDKLMPGDSEGIIDTKWFDYPEALKQVEYRDTERLFKVGYEKIKLLEQSRAEARQQRSMKGAVSS